MKKYENAAEASIRKLRCLEENLHLRVYRRKGDAIRSAICNAYLLTIRHDLMFIYTQEVCLALQALPNLIKSIDDLNFVADAAGPKTPIAGAHESTPDQTIF